MTDRMTWLMIVAASLALMIGAYIYQTGAVGDARNDGDASAFHGRI